MKKFLIISLVVNLFLIGYFVGKRIYYSRGKDSNTESKVSTLDSITTLTYNKYDFFDIKRKIYALLPIKKTDILFIGDSQTEQFPVSEMFETVRIKNRGITGSASSDILKTASQTTIPNTVFLLAGVNDYYNKVPVDSTVKCFEQLIQLFRSKNPDVKIIIQSTLPISNKSGTEQIALLDSKVKAICKQQSVTYVDMFSRFSRDGVLPKDLTVDGTHLSPKGYLLWHDLIATYIPK